MSPDDRCAPIQYKANKKYNSDYVGVLNDEKALTFENFSCIFMIGLFLSNAIECDSKLKWLIFMKLIRLITPTPRNVDCSTNKSWQFRIITLLKFPLNACSVNSCKII